VIYGREAAILGVICILAGLSPLLLIGLALWGIDFLQKRLHD